MLFLKIHVECASGRTVRHNGVFPKTAFVLVILLAIAVIVLALIFLNQKVFHLLIEDFRTELIQGKGTQTI